MNLSPAYLQQREEWKLEGIQEIIESLLKERFGILDEELSNLVEQIAQLPISERTQLLLSAREFISLRTVRKIER